MSGVMWFGIVVLVSVVVSGSVGVILNTFLGDSKEGKDDGGVVRGVETSRDEKSDVIQVGSKEVRKDWFNGYLAGFYDGSGREDAGEATQSMKHRLSGGLYAR